MFCNPVDSGESFITGNFNLALIDYGVLQPTGFGTNSQTVKLGALGFGVPTRFNQTVYKYRL